MKFVNATSVILMVLSAVIAAHLGWSWIEEGYGLHPAIAYPVATSLIFMAIGYTAYLFAEARLNSREAAEAYIASIYASPAKALL